MQQNKSLRDSKSLKLKKAKMDLVLDLLSKNYSEARIALNFSSPLELLIATILSAQCTDERVNIVTEKLFKDFRSVDDYLTVDIDILEKYIFSTGFYKNKAKNIKAAAKIIYEEYDSVVPDDLQKLILLPGVGRKTANVVLGDAYNIPGITVDTHVGRLSRRLGFTKHVDPVKVEFALHKLIPQPEWTTFSHRLILHGRAVCNARKPKCDHCTLQKLCPAVGVSN